MIHRHRPHFFLAIVFTLACVAAPLTSPAAKTAPRAIIAVPSTVGDGTAFPCTISGEGLQSATFNFLGRTVTAAVSAEGVSGSENTRETITVLLPVPLDHKNKKEQLRWTAIFTDRAAAGGTTPVTITRRAYPVQKLTLAQKYVTPDPALRERIARERKLLSAALNAKSPDRYWNMPMIRPVPGKITSWYGLRRVLNGQPRSAHRGLDFRAAAGDPISCVADGTVVLSGDFYYPGKFVVVDHGQGVTSIYMHMSEINVTDGQPVAAKEIVGRIGSTGRSTGPHLHLGITVLGHSIDPLPLLAATPEDLTAYEKAFSKPGAAANRPHGKNMDTP